MGIGSIFIVIFRAFCVPILMVNLQVTHHVVIGCLMLSCSKVFQRRFSGDVNFTRNWEEYKQGFGDLDGDFWLGELLLSCR